jgi:hypothetical protein
VSEDQDWRLTVELDGDDSQRALEGLRERARSSQVVRDAESVAPHSVVITHDGERLFAYAAERASLDAARSAIETAMRDDGIAGSIRVSHWDEQLDVWKLIDPPPTAEQARAEEASDRNAEAIATTTLVVSTGKEIRAGFERSMSTYAEELGVQCKLLEHPHLLTTQVAFTVTGPRRKLQEFAEGLKAEERATIRTERLVMASPL